MTKPGSLQMVAARLLVLATIVFVLSGTVAHVGPRLPATIATVERSAATTGLHAGGQTDTARPRREDGTGISANPFGDFSPAGGDVKFEMLLGINPGSQEAIAAIAGVSVLLATALRRWATPAIPIAATVFALIVMFLDLREVVQPYMVFPGEVTALALLAATLHAGVAVCAGLALARRAVPAGSASRRYARSVRREQDWIAGSLQILVKEDQRRHGQK